MPGRSGVYGEAHERTVGRFGLFGHVDHAHSPFPDLLEQRVAPDDGSGTFGRRVDGNPLGGSSLGGTDESGGRISRQGSDLGPADALQTRSQ